MDGRTGRQTDGRTDRFAIGPINVKKPCQASLLYSVRELEFGTNAPKNLGRPLTDFPAVFSAFRGETIQPDGVFR